MGQGTAQEGEDRSAPAAAGDDQRSFYTLMRWGFITLLPVAAMYTAFGLLTGSEALLTCAVLTGISITVQCFSLYAVRQVLRGDRFAFPYGAGKLEDFAAFLCGVLFVPSGVFLAVDAVLRLVHAVPVAYGIGLVPVAVSGVRMVVLYVAVMRLARRATTPSPLLRAYVYDYRTSLANDIGVFVAFLAAFVLVQAGVPAVGDRIDPVIALAISLYMVWAGVGLVRRNFRDLMDLPLPEAEQLEVMRLLAAHYADYETIGTLYTRASGTRRIVEVELVFDGTRTLDEIEALTAAMEADLAAGMPGLSFRLIPLTRATPA